MSPVPPAERAKSAVIWRLNPLCFYSCNRQTVGVQGGGSTESEMCQDQLSQTLPGSERGEGCVTLLLHLNNVPLFILILVRTGQINCLNSVSSVKLLLPCNKNDKSNNNTPLRQKISECPSLPETDALTSKIFSAVVRRLVIMVT